MKRYVCLLSALVVCGLPVASAKGQPADRAAQMAERQELEEKYKSLAAAVQALQDSNAALQRKLDVALAEIAALREKAAKPPANPVTQEDLKRLADSILEVDKSRLADNKLVLEKIAELGKALKTPPAAPAPRRTNETSGAPKNEKGYEYIVEAGDTLGKIVKKYRDKDIKVSQKAIEEANPDVNWTRLKIGQKLWVPAPKE